MEYKGFFGSKTQAVQAAHSSDEANRLKLTADKGIIRAIIADDFLGHLRGAGPIDFDEAEAQKLLAGLIEAMDAAGFETSGRKKSHNKE